MKKKENSYIINGYKGIMKLDLTNVEKKYHKLLIDQHYKDIKLYKQEQHELPTHLQYENTIIRAEKIQYMDYIAQKKDAMKNLPSKQRMIKPDWNYTTNMVLNRMFKKIYKYIHLNIYRINIPFYRILLMRTPQQPPSSSSPPSS